MFANRYTCIVDACSLVGVLRRNILLSLAEAEFYRLRWSEDILSETEEAIAKILLKINYSADEASSKANDSIEAMKLAFPESCVEDYEALIASLNGLPDPDDAHVVAAAIKTSASMIVTENIKDFPSEVLNVFELEAKTTDEFIADTIELDVGRAVAAIARMRARFERPSLTPSELLLKMESQGLVISADSLRPYIDSL